MDLDEVKEQVRSRHIRICKHKGIDPQTAEDEDTEKALAAKQFKRPFKGMCNTCGKQGHKSADCWENEKNKSKRPANWRSSKSKNNNNNNNNNNKNNDKNNSEKTCFYCKKKGHVKEDCFKLKKKQEKANSSAEQAEVVLVGMCKEIFNHKEDSLSYPEEDIYPVEDDFFDYFHEEEV